MGSGSGELGTGAGVAGQAGPTLGRAHRQSCLPRSVAREERHATGVCAHTDTMCERAAAFMLCCLEWHCVWEWWTLRADRLAEWLGVSGRQTRVFGRRVFTFFILYTHCVRRGARRAALGRRPVGERGHLFKVLEMNAIYRVKRRIVGAFP